ncbi:GNAT family N-acetyltransferase [Pseudomonas mosselii]|uniref:GNAT family N-acetyltransferase n=3 Tax=Pseudomonas mosselii TaxID=78327 RepID=UPI000A10F13D|nr:GNAT family N-acetyltransferase [Pseudomonas mosselii]ATB63227.1 GNAT family N-acetyltransferase [Pseudomonas mosselii]MBC3453200.1 GNAT family N-acetyltransferase [Pseudomonas mosselii]MDH1715524.1 GNAT family N-acetyltransferase [Pseudomonas mosselii]MDH1720215.1 GNAT family N-acetyltransferase [Pseudomonas mosselii]MEA3233628.1 GNAT family N-acetyltransferase [Pseudomonas mosselii]
MALQLSWCASLRSDDFPAADYEALRRRLPGSTPFNHLGWLRAAEAALLPGQQLGVLLGHQDQRLCLCLPLVRAREPFGPLFAPVVRHLGYPLNDRIALLIDLPALYADQVLQAIRKHLPHALLQLNEVPDNTEHEGWLRQWASASSTWQQRLTCRVPVHRINEQDRQEVSGDPRYKLRRARKRINACGASVRRVMASTENMGELLDAISAVEAVSWKGDDEVGIFSGPQRRQWMYQAFTALAGEGLVCLVLLELDGRCISYRLGLVERGRVYDYNLAFVPEHRDLGSGRVLLEEWIHWGLDADWKWIDASRVSLDNSSHQLHERMTGQLEQWRLSSYSWRPDGVLLGLAQRCWHWLKPRLRRRSPRNEADVVAPTPPQERPDAIPGHSQR